MNAKFLTGWTGICILLAGLSVVFVEACGSGGDPWAPSCENDKIDGQESDADCGGDECAPCELGKSCEENADCKSGNCENGECKKADLCGNGEPDPGETCDGDCPTSCDDSNPCTVDLLTGSAAECTAACAHTAITACAEGDGCCPSGCVAAVDADCDDGCLDVAGGGTAQQTFDEQSGTFEVVWDVTPQGGDVDAVVALSIDPPATPDWSDLATIVRFRDTGVIDARDGSAYAAELALPYTSGATYRVREVVDVPNGRYSVWVTAPGASEVELAQSYSFRTEQAGVTALNHVSLVSAAGPLRACQLALGPWVGSLEVMIDETIAGSCTLPESGGCEATSTVSAVMSGGDGSAKTYAWVVTGATLASGQGTHTITVTSNATEDVPYTAQCTVSDATYTVTESERFMHVRGTQGSCASSPYLEPVDIPPYDAGNPEHVLVTTSNGLWSSSNFNNASYKHFFVAPGDYSGTPLSLTAEGTESEPRTISLHNGNDTHPGKLSESEQMNVQLSFSGARWWVVDRMSVLDNSDADHAPVVLEDGTQHVVINRAFSRNAARFVYLPGDTAAPYTSDNTIQKSRIVDQHQNGLSGDKVAIHLSREDRDSPCSVRNTKIVSNEVLNFNDSVMLQRQPADGERNHDFQGTIIDCNHFYVNEDVYTDGGIRALTENAIDLKGGSQNPENPVIISNNIMWGYRHTAESGGGSGSWGVALTGHYNVENVQFVYNIVHDSNGGIGFGAPENWPYSTDGCLVARNLFYNNGVDYDVVIYFNDSRGVTLEKNVIIGTASRQLPWFKCSNPDDMTVTDNVAIEMLQISGNYDSITIHDNYHYSTPRADTSHGPYYSEASDSNMTNLTYTTDIYTNNPREITLPGVVSTLSSPHWDAVQ
ncbi:MAG: hypothetical protein KAI66_24140 [Lentisphaeria bacterium]|nr:hypothetical protein [Lentisphaeria bacterium]